MAAEALALLECIDSTIFIRQILGFLLHKEPQSKKIPITCFTDNRDLKTAVSSRKDSTEKRLRIDIQAIRDVVSADNVEIQWVPTEMQLADVFTKTGVSPRNLLDAMKFGVQKYYEDRVQ